MDYKKSENMAHTEYNVVCKQLGISGYSTARRELMEKVVELSGIYQSVAAKTKGLDKVVEFYSAFVEFTLGRQYDSNCVPIIKYIIGKLLVIFVECTCEIVTLFSRLLKYESTIIISY